MKVLILAAGRGTRISRYLSGRPKCTVDIGGEPLIVHTVRQLQKLGVKDIGIIVGYNKNVIEDLLKEFNVTFFYNPFFDVTNSIASAWFAKDFIEEDKDIMIMNGDVYVENSLLLDIVNEKKSPILFCDETRKEEADYKFYYEDDVLLKYGKELSGDEITAEYIGIAKIGKDFTKIFKKNLITMVENQEHSLWWENALYELSSSKNIYVKDVEGKFWAEVDYIEDYERILQFRDYKINFKIDVSKKDTAK